MSHPIYRVRSFEIVAPYTLRVRFDDNTEQAIDFRPVLAGELYRPLRNLELFNQVRIDPEVETLVWPNGADFDPATTRRIHDAVMGAFAAIGGRDYSRVDVIVRPSGEPVVLEVNSLPGMTETSSLPKAAAAAGITYPELCQRIVDLAMARMAK